MIYFDGVILAHCNESEWNRFQSEHTNEAILDRVVKVNVPYVLELEQEIKIYEKILGRSNFKAHIAPHTIRIASMFSVLSRLRDSQKCDPLTKLKLYNGEEVVEKGRVKKIDIKDLRDDFWKNVNVPGGLDEMNNELEKAGRVADFLELGELFAKDALERNESCGGHFREEFATPEGEAKRNDKDYTYVSAWEYKGEPSKAVLHKEELVFDNIEVKERSYK